MGYAVALVALDGFEPHIVCITLQSLPVAWNSVPGLLDRNLTEANDCARMASWFG